MRKLTLFLVLLCCTVFVSPAIAANKVRAFVAVNGGGVGALDRVSQANFEDGDISIVVITGTQLKYTYVYDEDGEQAEDATYFTIIRPDDYAVGVHDLVRVAYLTRVVTADGDTDPGVNDDIDTQTGAVDLNFAGYVPGDFWINDTASPTLFWVCIKNTDTAAVWQELTGDGTFEPIDAAIVKSDEAETITANWDFSTDSTSDLDDADITDDLTVSYLNIPVDTAAPTPPILRYIYRADGINWDPGGLGIDKSYLTGMGVTGSELFDDAENQNFTGGGGDWTDVDLGTFDDTTDLSLIGTAAQYCTLAVAEVPMVQNSWYVLEFDAAAIVATWTVSDFDAGFTIGTISANGTDQRILYQYTDASGGGLRITAVGTSTVNLDNFSVKEATWVVLFDEDYTWYVSAISTPTPVTDDADDFDNAGIFTGANLYGGTFVTNGDGGTINLPVMAEGMNFCVITGTAQAVIIDTNAADGYFHNGLTGTEGKNITNLSTLGDIACLQYYDADDWLITTNGWTAE